MLTLTVTGLVVAAIMPGTERWSRRFFISLFATVMLLTAMELIDLLIWEDPTLATAEKVVAFFEYLLLSVQLPMFTAYLLHTCGEELRKSSIFRAVIVIWGIYFILLGIAQVTTFLYYITPDNQFYRGSLHPLLMAPLVTILFINLAGVIRQRSRLPKKYYVAFLIHVLPLTATFLMHTFFFVPVTTFMGVVLSTLSMFGIILYDQIEQFVRQQREIAHQRASIMVLQMRPHFIYNVMTSIYYLCAQNPSKAQQVTLDFTAYLRKNFTAIASEDTIPFSDELEHTRAYLAVEQVQCEDRLFVEYDTPHKDFRLPPLTLQPIVENAVKHGMDPEYAPLRIFIQTRKTSSGSEFVVEDDGRGFTSADNSEPHIALANIKQRLAIMCGGKLTIRPRAGGGTVVTVVIPPV